MPPFRWADHYDLVALAEAAVVAVALWVVGAPWWWIVIGAAFAVSVGAFLLRRRAGEPQVTIWQRLTRRP